MQQFSVLISVFYKEYPAFLRQALHSIWYEQTLKPTEIVLVKDGPLTKELDNVIEDAMREMPLKTVILPTNQGLGVALNEGLKNCTYDIVARMDSDDIAMPNRFSIEFSYLENHPNVDVVGAWITEFEDDPSEELSKRKVPENHVDICHYAKSRCPINHPVVMFRKSAVEKAGGYQHCFLLEDYWLWVRMLIQGARFYNIPQSLLWFRTSPDMFRRRAGLRYVKSEVQFQYRLLKIGFISPLQYIKNISIRFCFRLIPNRLRMLLYKKFLR